MAVAEIVAAAAMAAATAAVAAGIKNRILSAPHISLRYLVFRK